VSERKFEISKEQYITVLEIERATLLEYYYKPDEEGTGHFNTAAGVLEKRIKELEEQE
jgi:hypothetical protein